MQQSAQSDKELGLAGPPDSSGVHAPAVPSSCSCGRMPLQAVVWGSLSPCAVIVPCWLCKLLVQLLTAAGVHGIPDIETSDSCARHPATEQLLHVLVICVD